MILHIPTSDKLKYVVDYTIKTAIKEELQSLDPKAKATDREYLITDICSRVIQKLNTALIENGVAYNEKFPASYYNSKVYDKVEKALQVLDIKPPLVSNLPQIGSSSVAEQA